MKKNISFLLLLFISNAICAATYYVSVNGNNANSGLKPTTSWKTIAYSATNAKAGDTVFIKAGKYGAENVLFANNGTPQNEIVFEGYRNKPGDIVPGNFKYGDTLNENKMPLLTGTSRNTGTAIDMITLGSKKYITVKNLQINNYETGVYLYGCSYITLDNLVLQTLGNIQNDYSGFGIEVGSKANNCTLKNCFVLNAAAEGITLNGDNNKAIKCSVYADDNATGIKSATDYYITIVGNKNTVDNCYVQRVGNLEHWGHGFCIKTNCEYNTISNSTAVNTGFELRHRGVKYNTITNCFAKDLFGFAVRDGASYNTINNCKAENTLWYAVGFFDTKEDGGKQYCGRHNTLNNCIFSNIPDTTAAFIYFDGYDRKSFADSNDFVNCVFDNGTNLFVTGRENHTNKMTNCIVSNVKKYTACELYYSCYDLDFNFTNCNFWNNGFAPPAGIKITTDNPQYVNISKGDYHLQSSSKCIDVGSTAKAPSFDFDNTQRPLDGNGDGIKKYDLGAFEYQQGFAAIAQKFSTKEPVFIYPNPAKDYIIINTNNFSLNNEIKIVDALGKIILKTKINSNTFQKIDIRNLNNGIYFIQVENLSQAFVKQ